MLKKNVEKKEKLKDEAYYAMKIKEVLVKGLNDDDIIYQIWSFGTNDEEMQNPAHGAMFADF